jgi:hypothetical protein
MSDEQPDTVMLGDPTMESRVLDGVPYRRCRCGDRVARFGTSWFHVVPLPGPGGGTMLRRPCRVHLWYGPRLLLIALTHDNVAEPA